jgi:catechol 2,3-dioxygenase-like lactoylglutathione lyase family enzyme
MLKGIDHLVIVVPELEAAVASYRGLGFTVVPGLFTGSGKKGPALFSPNPRPGQIAGSGAPVFRPPLSPMSSMLT